LNENKSIEHLLYWNEAISVLIAPKEFKWYKPLILP